LKEYLAMQLPIIASDIPAHRLVIEKTGGATLIRNNEAGSIADAILTFYKNQKMEYQSKPREQLVNIISFQSQAQQFIEYISSLNT